MAPSFDLHIWEKQINCTLLQGVLLMNSSMLYTPWVAAEYADFACAPVEIWMSVFQAFYSLYVFFFFFLNAKQEQQDSSSIGVISFFPHNQRSVVVYQSAAFQT